VTTNETNCPISGHLRGENAMIYSQRHHVRKLTPERKTTPGISDGLQAIIALYGAGLITRSEARAWLGIDDGA
jgi:hypothetical protein